jgi:Carboxypeptidase regulatory-like domain/TonB dependent receptor
MKRAVKHFLWKVAGLTILSLLMSVWAFSQTTGNLQGVVKDSNGAAVAGASVKITNTETNVVRETTTNDDGIYRVTNLNPGSAYKVEISASGFENKVIDNVAIRLATENSVDIELGVQGVGGIVTVTGDNPIINTTQNQLSTSYSQEQLQQLPYNGGSIDNLALLTPGISTPGDTDFTNGVGISANGNRGRSNNFQLDGQDNNDNSVAGPTLSITNAEAIGDYQVITNNPSAEFGRNAGAQVNVVTRSGTNEFHGSAFEYYQGNKLNARNNLQKQSAQAYQFLSNNGFPEFSGLANRKGQDVFSYNRFGGALGGPIVKNKAFFFVTYQQDVQNGETDTSNFGSGGLTFTPGSVNAAANLGFFGARQILSNTNVGGGPAFAQGQGQFIVVPALIDTNGDGVVDSFANGVNAYGNRFTISEIACNITVPAGSPCPAANQVPLFTGEAARVAPNKSREYQLITREDFNITDKDSVVFRYIFDRTRFPNSPATGSFLAGAFFDVPSRNDNVGVTYTRQISSRFTNEARFNFSYLNVLFGDPKATLPAPGISFTGQRDIVGNFTSLGFGTGNALPQSRTVKVYQEQDTVRATLGNHSISAGIDLRQQKVDNFFLPNFLGIYRFNAAGTLPASTFFDVDGSPLSSATAFENLLLGRPDRINFALGNPNIKTTQNDYFFFVQDDWRVRSNLTLNLGVRYEYSSTPFNPIIKQINAREADASTAIFNTAFPIETRTATPLKTDKNNFAPRVGFAYTPNLKFLGGFFDNRQTVIRAGFGVAYDPSFFNIVLNTVTAAPYAASGTIQQTPGATGSVNYPFLPTTTAQLNTTPGTFGGDPRLFNQTRVDPGFYSPYTLQWSAGIQQELFKDTVLEVRYVGSRIVGQYQTVNANPNVRFLNNLAQCLGLSGGSFTNGITVGNPAASQTAACSGSGYQNRPRAVNPVTGISENINGNGRLDPNFGAIRLRNNGATSTYSGLQMRFDTRFSNVVFNANYTLSKTIDNASEIFSTFAGGQSVAIPQNPFDSTTGERGLSAFHQKHNFTANFIYKLPFYREQKGVVGKMLGGFEVSGIVRLASGRPYTPVEFFGNYDTGFDSAFVSGVGPLRPYNGNSSLPNGTIAFSYAAACLALFGGPECDYNGGGAGPGNFIVYNTLQPGSIGTVVGSAAAAQQSARLVYNDSGLLTLGIPASDLEAFQYFRTPYGDVGRNTFFGNNFYNVNLAVFKTTNITERFKIEFRAEAANLFNSRNFGVPDAITEDASFVNFVGSFQNPGFNAGSSRSLRLGLRFLF